MNQRLTGVVTASAITNDPATAEALSTSRRIGNAAATRSTLTRTVDVTDEEPCAACSTTSTTPSADSTWP
jgi:hypothetical protein